jgi:hypothetical protein
MKVAVEKSVQVSQVLLLRDQKLSHDVGPAIWASFEEVRRFFGKVEPLEVHHEAFSARIQPEFSRCYVSRLVPEQLSPEHAVSDADEIERLWRESVGSTGVYDQRVLGELVGALVKPEGTMVLVTDVELIPPPDWRYIIWDTFPLGCIVSLAPLDPRYWGERMRHDDRVHTIKSRARAAMISIVGSLVGLTRCANDRCYLFADVDSVLRLDEMTHLGPEHEVATLSFQAFADETSPEDVQKVIRLEPKPA